MRKRAEVHDVGAKPEQVARNAVQFRADHPNVLGSKGNLDPEELFHGEHKPVIVEHPGEVIYSARIGHKLPVCAVLPIFSWPAMAIADNRVSLDDVFPI